MLSIVQLLFVLFAQMRDFQQINANGAKIFLKKNECEYELY